MSSIPFYKKKVLYLGLSRYLLGLIMVAYGLTKILRAQIVVIPFAIWQRPLEYVSGKSLAWAFLGHAGWFQTLLGLLEFFPGVLLLFTRATFIGALLLLPVTLNVYLVNIALNLWADTKVLSLILVLLNMVVLLLEWDKLKSLFRLVVGSRVKSAGIWEVAVNLLLLIVLFFLTIPTLWTYIHSSNELTGDWYHGHPNEWILRSEMTKDSSVHWEPLKCYFGPYGQYSELNDTGFTKRDIYKYGLNDKNKILTFYNVDSKIAVRYHYQLVGDTALFLQKPLDSSQNYANNQVFVRRVMQTSR